MLPRNHVKNDKQFLQGLVTLLTPRNKRFQTAFPLKISERRGQTTTVYVFCMGWDWRTSYKLRATSYGRVRGGEILPGKLKLYLRLEGGAWLGRNGCEVVNTFFVWPTSVAGCMTQFCFGPSHFRCCELLPVVGFEQVRTKCTTRNQAVKRWGASPVKMFKKPHLHSSLQTAR